MDLRKNLYCCISLLIRIWIVTFVSLMIFKRSIYASSLEGLITTASGHNAFIKLKPKSQFAHLSRILYSFKSSPQLNFYVHFIDIDGRFKCSHNRYKDVMSFLKWY